MTCSASQRLIACCISKAVSRPAGSAWAVVIVAAVTGCSGLGSQPSVIYSHDFSGGAAGGQTVLTLLESEDTPVGALDCWTSWLYIRSIELLRP